jgi:hypothetical protein
MSAAPLMSLLDRQQIRESDERRKAGGSTTDVFAGPPANPGER